MHLNNHVGALDNLNIKLYKFKGTVTKTKVYRYYVALHHSKALFKGTGTRDLIWLKVVSLDRSWLVGLTDDL